MAINLVVDDEHDMVKMIKGGLESVSHGLIAVSHGQEGVEKAEQEKTGSKHFAKTR